MKERAKLLEREAAALEVAAFENQVERLGSLHQECRAPIDWVEMADASAPREAGETFDAEEVARQDLESYQPNFWDKLFKRVDTKRAELEIGVERARAEDRERAERARREHNQAVEDWEATCKLARQVLEGDPATWRDVFQGVDPLQEIAEVGSEVRIQFREDQLVEATLFVHGDQIIPSERKSLLKSGKVSIKAMPKGQFNELYQDCVCSATLRIANEIFAALPAAVVVVTAIDQILDTATGHLEEQPILSVAIPRTTLAKIHLDYVDPSDSMSNFVHEMSFSKMKGFSPVEKIDLGSFTATA